MKPVALPAVFLVLFGLAIAFAPAAEHASEASRVLATYAPAGPQAADGAGRAKVARTFLAALDDEQRAAFALAADDSERAEWTNLPVSKDARGLRFGDLAAEQMQLACDLLRAGLSQQGYAKMRDIMLADDRLLPNGEARAGFGAEEFRLVLFGEPQPAVSWGLQLDGHHIGLNLTFVGDRVTMSPSFIGTQPAAYDRAGTRVVPMRGETSSAFALLNSLTEEQRKATIQSERRGRLAAGPGRDGVVPEPEGLACDGLDETQRALLTQLLREFLGALPEADAAARLAALEREIDAMHFAWNGPTDDPSDVSYRLQGPSVIIEYACQDLGGDPLDHLHSMYRDPGNEYGAAFAMDRR